MTTDPRPLLVLLTGYAGAGKDTAGEAMARGLGLGQLTLAQPLYRSFNAIYPAWVGTDFDKDGPEAYLGGRTPRHFLLALGELVRGFNPNALLDLLGARLPVDQSVVVTDVRFQNEVFYLSALARERGLRFCLVRVRRPGQVLTEKHFDDSEHELNSWPDTAFNIVISAPTAEALQARAVEALKEWIDKE